MAIYISKNNQRLGPFEESAVVDFVRSGAFSPYDLACYEGTNNWQPIHTLLPYLNQSHESHQSHPSQQSQQTWVAQTSVPAKPKSSLMSPALMGLLITGVVGFLVGGFIGFSMRPAAPFIGQLPFEVVITRGDNLRGLDVLLVGIAQQSFNYMATGAVLGAVLGALCGIFVGPRLISSAK